MQCDRHGERRHVRGDIREDRREYGRGESVTTGVLFELLLNIGESKPGWMDLTAAAGADDLKPYLLLIVDAD